MKIRALLIAGFIIVLNQEVLAQNNPKVTSKELLALALEGNYKEVLSYIEQFKDGKDGPSLVILGDCSWNEANIEEAMNTQFLQRSIAHSSMLAAQGIYLDNTIELGIHQQNQLRIVQLRVQAVDLYSRAAQLGNEVGIQRLAYLNHKYTAGNGGPSPDSTSPGGTSVGGKLTRTPCHFCNGTGVNPSSTSVPGFGLSTRHWCDVCKSEVGASHGAHQQCPSCNGKGYTESYR